MGRIAKAEAPQVEKMEGFEGRYAQIDDYTVGFETYTTDNDPADSAACPTTTANARTGGSSSAGS
jgi:hypothetical protein